MGLIHLLCQSYHLLDKSNTILRPLRKLEPATLQRLVTGALVRCLRDSNYQSAIRACTKLQGHARVKSQPMLDELKEICTNKKKRKSTSSTPKQQLPDVATATATATTVSSPRPSTTTTKSNKKTPIVIPSLSDILSLSSYQKSKLAKVTQGVWISSSSSLFSNAFSVIKTAKVPQREEEEEDGEEEREEEEADEDGDEEEEEENQKARKKTDKATRRRSN